MEVIAIISFIIYLFIIAAIATVAWQMTKNLSDFVLGGAPIRWPCCRVKCGCL